MALLGLVLFAFLLPSIATDDPHVKDGYTEHPEYRFASCISEQFSTSKKGVTVEAGGDDAGAEAEGRPQPFRPPTLVGIEEDDLAEVEAEYKPKLKRSIQVEMRQRVGKKYGESFPLEIAIVGDLGKLKHKPDKNVGIHVSQYGVDGSRKDCLSAGEDYNPLGTRHGNIWDNPKKRHVGDWGNLRLKKGRYVDARFNDYLASIVPEDSGKLSILGKSIVLFAKEDDLGKKKNDQSISDGNVGTPVLCCAVKMSDGTFFPHEDKKG